jgi:hypothetical protein
MLWFTKKGRFAVNPGAEMGLQEFNVIQVCVARKNNKAQIKLL